MGHLLCHIVEGIFPLGTKICRLTEPQAVGKKSGNSPSESLDFYLPGFQTHVFYLLKKTMER